MQLHLIPNTALFRGTTKEEAEAMLGCLDAKIKPFDKGETVYHAGEVIESMGLVLSGAVIIESSDLWGNNSVLGYVAAGEIFAETYACIPGEPLMVDVVACEKSEILFLNAARLFTTCPQACAHHSRLIHNLVRIFAEKNLNLSRRMLHCSSKTIRGRLLSYLSEQAKMNGGYRFSIPCNRQQLADYLGVDRSAMSNELSKMQRDGLLTYSRNSFVLK